MPGGKSRRPRRPAETSFLILLDQVRLGPEADLAGPSLSCRRLVPFGTRDSAPGTEAVEDPIIDEAAPKSELLRRAARERLSAFLDPSEVPQATLPSRLVSSRTQVPQAAPVGSTRRVSISLSCHPGRAGQGPGKGRQHRSSAGQRRVEVE